MKGLNSIVFRARSRCARFNVLRPVTCSVPNVSRIGRRGWYPRGLRAGGSQYAEVLLQHLDVVLGSSGSVLLGRWWHVEGDVAMVTLEDSR